MDCPVTYHRNKDSNSLGIYKAVLAKEIYQIIVRDYMDYPINYPNNRITTSLEICRMVPRVMQISTD